TRNQQCRAMWQLLKKGRHFMETVSPFPGGKNGQTQSVAVLETAI
ncbi:IS630 family transposase, partial [Escherichia coli]|nr:IS630 family transposase [Escherichia coli]